MKLSQSCTEIIENTHANGIINGINSVENVINKVPTCMAINSELPVL